MSRRTAPLLPRGWRDLVLQVLLLAFMIFAYQLTRGLSDDSASAEEAIANARHVVAAERAVGLYFEPSWQRAALGVRNLTDVLSWVYLNVQTTLTLGGLFWIYFRHNHRYNFVRNMFFVSFVGACVIYVLLPTAPPRLMPAEYGFVDSVERLSGPRKFVWEAFANPYAAMPSMHIAFAFMIGLSIRSLSTRWWVRAAWMAYPAAILWVVVATGNHFWLDAAAGAAVAAVGAFSAYALGRLRPTTWAWTGQPSEATT
jgi:membrane-associated phospholipid phosphatase